MWQTMKIINTKNMTDFWYSKLAKSQFLTYLHLPFSISAWPLNQNTWPAERETNQNCPSLKYSAISPATIEIFQQTSAMAALDSASEAAFHELFSSFLISSTCFMQLSNTFFLSSDKTRTWSRCSWSSFLSSAQSLCRMIQFVKNWVSN